MVGVWAHGNGHDLDVDPVLRGERAISSIGRLFMRSRSPLRRRLLPSRLPTCPFKPLACLAPLLPTSVAMSALKRLLTGQHKLEKHHSLPSNTEARLDYVFQPRARPSLPLRLMLGLPPTHWLPYPWVADGAILHLLSPLVIEIFIPAGAGVDLTQSRNVSSPKTPGLPVYPRFDTTCGTEKSSYDAVSPLFLYADSCGFLSPSVPLGPAQG